MQQKSKMLSRDFKPMDQRFEATVEHAGSHLPASPAEGANQASSSSSLPASSSTSTSAPQPAIPDPAGFQMPRGLHPLRLHHAQQPGPAQPQQQSDQQPVQVRGRITRISKPRESTKVTAIIQDIQDDHLPISQDQVNADHQNIQSEEELFQGFILQKWYEGNLQDYSAEQIKTTIT